MESVRAFIRPGLTANCKSIGFEGAIYKSFDTQEEAERAYNTSPYLYIQKKKTTAPAVSGNAPTDVPSYRHDTVLPLPPEVPAEALAVDAACSGNPGPMEYRGVYLRTGETVFHFGPVYGTNNIGEFLAIVHALALMEQKNIRMPVFSDSRNAIGWVKQKRCKTKLERPGPPYRSSLSNDRTGLEPWLKTHKTSTSHLKWETERWGEVPADFGRK